MVVVSRTPREVELATPRSGICPAVEAIAEALLVPTTMDRAGGISGKVLERLPRLEEPNVLPVISSGAE